MFNNSNNEESLDFIDYIVSTQIRERVILPKHGSDNSTLFHNAIKAKITEIYDATVAALKRSSSNITILSMKVDSSRTDITVIEICGEIKGEKKFAELAYTYMILHECR